MKILIGLSLTIAISFISCKSFDCIVSKSAQKLIAELDNYAYDEVICSNFKSLKITMSKFQGCRIPYSTYTEITYTVNEGWKGYSIVRDNFKDEIKKQEFKPSKDWDFLINKLIDKHIYYPIGDFDDSCKMWAGNDRIKLEINDKIIVNNLFNYPNRCEDKYRNLKKIADCYDIIENSTNISTIRKMQYNEIRKP